MIGMEDFYEPFMPIALSETSNLVSLIMSSNARCIRLWERMKKSYSSLIR